MKPEPNFSLMPQHCDARFDGAAISTLSLLLEWIDSGELTHKHSDAQTTGEDGCALCEEIDTAKILLFNARGGR
jgi:hypothetical protein